MAYTIQSHGQVDPWSAHSQHVCLSHSILFWSTSWCVETYSNFDMCCRFAVAVLHRFCKWLDASGWLSCWLSHFHSVQWQSTWKKNHNTKQLDRPSNDSRCWNLFLRSDTTEVQRLPALIPLLNILNNYSKWCCVLCRGDSPNLKQFFVRKNLQNDIILSSDKIMEVLARPATLQKHPAKKGRSNKTQRKKTSIDPK